jgi:hypothetical protein
VVNVPRATSYEITPSEIAPSEITPEAGRFEYVAVRVFPTGHPTRIGIGAALEPHPMPDVAAKAQIDSTLAVPDKNVTPPLRRCLGGA